MMHLKPIHHGLGLALLSLLVIVGCAPSQGPTVTSSLTEAADIAESAVNPDSVDQTSAEPEHSTDSPEAAESVAESTAEPPSQPASLQASNTIVSIAQSEISDAEWQVVESELALFYAQKNAQKNASSQPPISAKNSSQLVLSQSAQVK